MMYSMKFRVLQWALLKIQFWYLALQIKKYVFSLPPLYNCAIHVVEKGGLLDNQDLKKRFG